MNIFISILRGINVSGQKKIAMQQLKEMYEKNGFQNVTTYVNSGNVVFSSAISEMNNIKEKTEKAILDKFGFEVPVILRTLEEMQAVIKNNPMNNSDHYIDSNLYFTFLSDLPDTEYLSKIESLDFKPDEFIVREKEIYVYCPNGYGRTKINNNFFEKKLKVTATTRNRKTVHELLRIGNAIRNNIM